MMRGKLWLVVGLGLLCAGSQPGKGCGGTDGDDTLVSAELQQLAEDAGEGSGASDAANSIVSIPLLALTNAAKVASATVAATTAVGVGTFFKPAGCVKATQNALVVTYTFKGCTGPFGLVGVNGTVTATFAPTTGGVTASVVSKDLKLNNTTVQQSAKVTVTFQGTTRKVTWNGGYKGVTYRGKKTIEHTASYTTTYDTSNDCVASDGNGSTTVDGRGHTVTVKGYKRCGTIWTCPTAGSLTVVGAASKLAMTLTYLGNGRARATGPAGNSWEYKMLWCTAK